MDLFGNFNKGISDLGKQAEKVVNQTSKGLGEVANFVGDQATQITNQAVQFVQENAGQVAKVSQQKMIETLDWAYQTTMNGIPGEKSIDDLVKDYLSKYNKEVAIEKLIQFQTTKAATSGFITGFGGVLTMPVSIPANVTTVILFQMRMIAAIASIRGYDLKSDQVQTFVYATLAGTSVSEIAKKAGIVIGNKLAVSMVKKIPGKILTKINQAVGFRLATKFGSTGVINIGKMVPVAGAVIGGVFDTTTTLAIANLAKATFTEEGINIGNGTMISTDSI